MLTICLSSSPITEVRHERGYTVTSGSPMEEVIAREVVTVHNKAEADAAAKSYKQRLEATGRPAQFVVVKMNRPGERAFPGFETWRKTVRAMFNTESVTVRAAA